MMMMMMMMIPLFGRGDVRKPWLAFSKLKRKPPTGETLNFRKPDMLVFDAISSLLSLVVLEVGLILTLFRVF